MPFHAIDDPVKLTRVIEALMLLQADIELPLLLGHVVEEARFLTGAQYGALGIFDSSGSTIEELLTSGLSEAEQARISRRPTGEGLLGLHLSDPRPLRLIHLDEHPMSTGLPAHHPPMDSMLSVPVEVRGEVYGSLVLTNKRGAAEFTSEDQALVEALAVAAGMAIENTRLHARVRDAAVIQDRDRTARDLHDNVVQHLYAIGITLESMVREAETSAMAERLALLVSDVGASIRQIRSSIYELGSTEENPGVRSNILSLVRSLDPMFSFSVSVTFDGPVDTVISQSIADQLLATIREAVTNIGRHAQATKASVTLSAHDGTCRLRVSDNGIGMNVDGSARTGLGLVNLRHRAESLHGAMAIECPETGGTVLEWSVPFSQ